MIEVVYVADNGTAAFENNRHAVDVVCVGDSLTGWNNDGNVALWPYPTYPEYLQTMCGELDLFIANSGMAGEVSPNGLIHVNACLDLFPNATDFIIGFGTNDLGTWPDVERTSRRIIANLDGMVRAIVAHKKRPLLFNVPYVNESWFPPRAAAVTHSMRDYHNEKLRQYCVEGHIPLADICTYLRDEHFADNLHPNGAGAKIIAQRVFEILRPTP
jgi:lysophospholipase L1-like esterase